MSYVQLVFAESQVELLSSSVTNAMSFAANDVEAQQLASLAYFLDAVKLNPSAFPVRTPAVSRSIKKRIAQARGTSQPEQGKPNRRKRTQARKIGFQKRTRTQKQAEARLFNEARDAALEALAIEQAQLDRERAESFGIVLPE